MDLRIIKLFNLYAGKVVERIIEVEKPPPSQETSMYAPPNDPKPKKKKDEIIQDIVIFEQDPTNIEVVFRRQKLWTYMQEIKDDKYLRKFLIFN